MTRPRWTLALTCLTSFMVGLDALVVTTALPAIGADLRAGLGARQGVVTAYLLAYAVGIVPASALGDRYGRRGSSPPDSRSSPPRRPVAPSRAVPPPCWPGERCRGWERRR